MKTVRPKLPAFGACLMLVMIAVICIQHRVPAMPRLVRASARRAFFRGEFKAAKRALQAGVWQQLPDPFNSGYSTTIRSIVIAPDDTIYVGGNGGVAMSTDGGRSWKVINTGLPTQTIIALGLNSQGEPIAGAGVRAAAGAFRYTGGRWEKARGINASYVVSAFTLDKTGAVIAVTGWAGDVFRSTDGGSTYTKVAANIGSATPGSTAGALWVVSKAPDGTLYTGGEMSGGLYSSADNGRTWHHVGLSDAEGYKGNLMAIGFDNGGDLLIGRGTPGGSTLQHHTKSGWDSAADLPPYVPIFSIVHGHGGTLFVSAARGGSTGSTGGVYRSTDNAKTWQDYSAGLPTAAMRRLAVDRAGYLYVVVDSDQPVLHALYKSVNAP